jgi:FtsP/CotA-like multicopper oxidase with cupredoxin domain
MKNIFLFCSLIISSVTFGQIDQSILIIGRNTGTHTFHDNEQTRIMGFTSSLSQPLRIPGPTLDIKSGDSIKIDFFNLSQGAPHTIHLHGLDVDQQNDGVPHLSFEVEHNEHGYYYFKAPHPGTYLYHCHVGSSIHLQAGMYGLVIVRPENGSQLLSWENGHSYDREFSLLASEIDTVWHNDTVIDHVHDMDMLLYVPETFEPQYFLVNGKSGTQLNAPDNFMFVSSGETVFLRLANIGYYGVRYILPSSLNCTVVSSDGRPLPLEFQTDTVEVLPGERYEALIEIGSSEEYNLMVQHFNLNTQIVESEQEMKFKLSAAGIEELSSFNIFPNPSNNLLIIGENPIEFVIIHSNGQLIKSGKESIVDISGLSKGLYILKLTDSTHRFIVD